MCTWILPTWLRATSLRRLSRGHDYLSLSQGNTYIMQTYCLSSTPSRKRGLWWAHHCQPGHRWDPLLEQELGQGGCICDISTSESWPDHSRLHQLLAGQVGAEWQAVGVAWRRLGASRMRTRAAHPSARLESPVRKAHWEFPCSAKHRQWALHHCILKDIPVIILVMVIAVNTYCRPSTRVRLHVISLFLTTITTLSEELASLFYR